MHYRTREPVKSSRHRIQKAEKGNECRCAYSTQAFSSPGAQDCAMGPHLPLFPQPQLPLSLLKSIEEVKDQAGAAAENQDQD